MNIGIVGLGLIGGSIGLKLQKHNHKVYGITNNGTNQEKALKRKLAHHISCDLNILKECNLIILALPIKDLINPTNELIKAIPKNTILTDVGSIKEPIVNTWEKTHPLFIGSHPMAGNEYKGVNAGDENLLNNAKWVITPTIKTNKQAIQELSKVINSVGCEVCEASPKEHDKAVSLISHLPIFVSSCLIETAKTNKQKKLLYLAQKLASSGFLDTSRVGGGNPDLGIDIASYNQQYLLEALQLFRENIISIEKLIEAKNWKSLHIKLQENKESRIKFCK